MCSGHLRASQLGKHHLNSAMFFIFCTIDWHPSAVFGSQMACSEVLTERGVGGWGWW